MEILLLQAEQVTREILNVLLPLADTRRLTVEAARDIIKKNLAKDVYTYVGYENNEPICTATLVVLDKLIHNGSKVILLEDVAVAKDYQGKGYGLKLIKAMNRKATKLGGYKSILVCKEYLCDFYSKSGYGFCGYYMRKNL
jgi:N-acetylglutamate synthase-like GNAT family acetyltransferase